MQKADVFYKRTEINRNVFGYKNFIYSLDYWKKNLKIGDINSAKKINDHIHCVHMGFHGFHLQQNK